MEHFWVHRFRSRFGRSCAAWLEILARVCERRRAQEAGEHTELPGEARQLLPRFRSREHSYELPCYSHVPVTRQESAAVCECTPSRYMNAGAWLGRSASCNLRSWSNARGKAIVRRDRANFLGLFIVVEFRRGTGLSRRTKLRAGKLELMAHTRVVSLKWRDSFARFSCPVSVFSHAIMIPGEKSSSHVRLKYSRHNWIPLKNVALFVFLVR